MVFVLSICGVLKRSLPLIRPSALFKRQPLDVPLASVALNVLQSPYGERIGLPLHHENTKKDAKKEGGGGYEIGIRQLRPAGDGGGGSELGMRPVGALRRERVRERDWFLEATWRRRRI